MWRVLAQGVSVDGFKKHIVPDMPSASEVLPFLERLDQNRWYSNFGPLVVEFEEKIRALLLETDDSRSQLGICVTTLASCHHALEIALKLSGVSRGDTVLVPAVTFPACPLAVSRVGGHALLADVDPSTWTLTPEIARSVTSKNRIAAVMPVTTYGVPLPASQWDDFTRETDIPVIIDAATAFGAQSIPQYCVVALSFHATKSFGIGEGGALVGRDPNYIATARQMSNFGTLDRICHTEGLNAKMSEYHAAVGLAQIRRWTLIKQRRRGLLEMYRQRLSGLGHASLQPGVEKAILSTLIIQFQRTVADELLREGKRSGVAYHRGYFPPLYRHPQFARLSVVDTEGTALIETADDGAKHAHMRNSERLFACTVGVPFHSWMTEQDVEVVMNHLASVVPSR